MRKTDPMKVAECRRLRTEERMSAHCISSALDLSIATVSAILRDIPLSKEEISAKSSEGAKKRIFLSDPQEMREDDHPNLSTIEKGKLAELYFEAECIKRNIECSKPIFDCRYDYVVRLNGVFKRVQIKWADSERSSGNIGVHFNSIQPRRTKNRVARYSSKEIDMIICYAPSINKFLKFEKDVFEKQRGMTLRLNPSRHGQHKRLKFAKDYFW